MYYKIRYLIGRLKLFHVELINIFCYRIRLRRTKNFDQLIGLQGKFSGKRCFIVGNGPSLNALDLTKLKDEYCFVFNGAYELVDLFGFEKAFLAIEDRLVLEDHATRVDQLGFPTFIPSDLSHLVTRSDIIETFFSRSYPLSSSKWPPFLDIKSRTPIFYWGGTVAYYGIELAAWLGFSECFIIGVDLSYSIPDHVTKKGAVLLSNGDDPNHYSANYFGAGKRWHVPLPERMARAFSAIARRDSAGGMKIFNAGYGGNLKAFPRTDYSGLFHND